MKARRGRYIFGVVKRKQCRYVLSLAAAYPQCRRALWLKKVGLPPPEDREFVLPTPGKPLPRPKKKAKPDPDPAGSPVYPIASGGRSVNPWGDTSPSWHNVVRAYEEDR